VVVDDHEVELGGAVDVDENVLDEDGVEEVVESKAVVKVVELREAAKGDAGVGEIGTEKL